MVILLAKTLLLKLYNWLLYIKWFYIYSVSIIKVSNKKIEQLVHNIFSDPYVRLSLYQDDKRQRVITRQSTRFIKRVSCILRCDLYLEILCVFIHHLHVSILLMRIRKHTLGRQPSTS